MREGRYTGVFDMWDLLALLLPKAATLDDLVPDLGFLGDDLPALQAKLTEIGGQPVGPLARPDLPLLEPDMSPCRGAAAPLPQPQHPARRRRERPGDSWRAVLLGCAGGGHRRTRNDRNSASGVWFGWDPLWVSTAILIVTYARDHDRAGQSRHRRAASAPA